MKKTIFQIEDYNGNDLGSFSIKRNVSIDELDLENFSLADVEKTEKEIVMRIQSEDRRVKL